jgi:hypothetical protein
MLEPLARRGSHDAFEGDHLGTLDAAQPLASLHFLMKRLESREWFLGQFAR